MNQLFLKLFFIVGLLISSSLTFAQREDGPHHGSGGGHHGGPMSSSSMSSRSSTHSTSSGTSDCLWGGPSCGHAQLQQVKQKYLAENFDALSEEVAQGHGPHLDALFQLTSCSREESKLVMVDLRQNYSFLFGTTSHTDKEPLNSLLFKRLNLVADSHGSVQCLTNDPFKNSILKKETS